MSFSAEPRRYSPEVLLPPLSECRGKGRSTRRGSPLKKADSVHLSPDEVRDLLGRFLDQDLQSRKKYMAARDYAAVQSIDERIDALESLLEGESFADPGSRDRILTRLVGILAAVAPNAANAEAIVAEIFGPVFDGWEDDSNTTAEREIDKALNKFHRFQEKQERLRKKTYSKLTEAVRSISQRFGPGKEDEGEDPDPDNANGEAAPDDGEPIDYVKYGIIFFQRFRYFYDWKNQQFDTTAYQNHDHMFSSLPDLWPPDDETCPFRYSFEDAEGRVHEYDMSYLRQHYGKGAREIILDFQAKKTWFNTNTNQLIIAPAPWRVVEGEYDEQIDIYLRLLGGAHYEDLIAWIAGATKLDQPSAALYLSGAPGTGKTFLADAVTSLWGVEPVAWHEAMDRFNDGLEKSPVVLIDEGFDSRAGQNTTLLRRMVTTKNHVINPKYRPKQTIRGYLRFVVTANNENVLLTREDERLSKSDNDAIAQRFLHIPVQDESARFFQKYNANRELTNRWIREAVFARHMLYLRRTIKPSGNSRFVVEGKRTQLHNRMITQGDERHAILEWLARYLQMPGGIDQGSRSSGLPCVLHGSGFFLVNAQGLIDRWGAFIKKDSYRAPTLPHAIEHLKALSTNEKSLIVSQGERQQRYWAIPAPIVVDWSDSMMIGDREEMERRVKEENELVARALKKASA